MTYKLPFAREELKYFLEKESVFRRQPKLSIDMFIKYFFPEKRPNAQSPGTGEADRDTSESSSELNRSQDAR